MTRQKFKSFIVKKQLPLIAESFIRSNYNPGQTFLGQYCNIHSFLSFLGSRFKQCILFEIFLQFSLPHPMQSWNSEKNLNTRVQHCLWGKGRGWACVNWKTPRKRKSVPRLLSMIVGLLSLRLRSHYTGKYIRGGTSRSHTSNLVLARLAERVWCAKFQSSLLNIYFRLSGFQSTLSLFTFTTVLVCEQKPYLIRLSWRRKSYPLWCEDSRNTIFWAADNVKIAVIPYFELQIMWR